MVERILRALKHMAMGMGGAGRANLEGGRLTVLGLGNPGSEYSETRHNAGADAVRWLARRHDARLRRTGRYVRAARIRLDGDGTQGSEDTVEIVVAVPLTFMNESGTAAAWLVDRCDIPVERFMVVHDDLDLPLGSIRLKFGGGSGGHRGVESVTRALGSNAFQRVRIGIGRPPAGIDPVDYVLSPFDASEEDEAAEAIKTAAEAVEFAARRGIDAAMSLYNSPERGAAG